MSARGVPPSVLPSDDIPDLARTAVLQLVQAMLFDEIGGGLPSAHEVDRLHAILRAAMGDQATETSLVQVLDPAPGTLWVLDLLAEPRPLLDFLPKKTGASLVARLGRLFSRRELHALTLCADATRTEMVAALGLALRVGNSEHSDALAGARLLLERDVMLGMTLAWTTRFAISAFNKDVADALDEAARAALAARATRAIRSAETLARLACHAELLDRPSALESWMAALPDDRLEAVIVSLARLRRAQPPEPVSPAAARALVLALARLAADTSVGATDRAERLLRAGFVTADELPGALQRRLEKRARARNLAGEVAARAEAIRRGETKLAPALEQYRELALELAQIGERAALAEMALAMHAVASQPSTPGRLRIACAESLATQAQAQAELRTALGARVADHGRTREERAEAGVLCATLGEAGVAVMIGLLRGGDERGARAALLDALATAPAAAEQAALALLGRHDEAPAVRQSLLVLLGRVGTSRALTAVRFALADQDAGVRAAAASAFGALAGLEAEAELVALLADQSAEVLAAALVTLGECGSHAPELAKLCLAALDPKEGRRHGERVQLAACAALARLGNLRLTDEADTEELLCAALGGLAPRLLGIRLPRRLPFDTAVSEAVCHVLGQIGTARGADVLAQVAERERGRVADHARVALAALQRRLAG